MQEKLEKQNYVFTASEMTEMLIFSERYDVEKTEPADETIIPMEKNETFDLQEYIKIGFSIRSTISIANDTLGGFLMVDICMCIFVTFWRSGSRDEDRCTCGRCCGICERGMRNHNVCAAKKHPSRICHTG